MTYKNALKYISQASRTSGMPTLSRMKLLCHYLGNPQEKTRFIHIAGTNGKGSAAAMLSSILSAAGYKTGLFVSPFINNFRERISIDGKLISPQELSHHTKIISDAAARMQKDITDKNPNAQIPPEILADNFPPAPIQPVQFEIVTALGLLYFAEQECDIVVLECGLGGRYDATNVIPPPLLSIITKIGLDHTELLGDSLEAIALEKLAIVKRGTAALVAYPPSTPSVSALISKTAEENKCRLYIPDMSYAAVHESSAGSLRFKYRGREYQSALPALFQLANACTVIESAKALSDLSLKISDADIAKGLQNAKLPARFELFGLSPTIIVDGAHNKDGIDALACSINSISSAAVGRERKVHMLVGMLNDKSHKASLAQFLRYTVAGGEGTLKIGRIAALSPKSARALPVKEMEKTLIEVFSDYCESVISYKSPSTAIKSILPQIDESDILVCFGSLYLAGECRAAIQKYFA